MAGTPTPALSTELSPSTPSIDGGLGLILGMISPYMGAVFMETWLYGIYCILFSICTYVLLRRHKALHLVLFVFAILMFSLASADIGYTYYLVFVKVLGGDLSFRLLYPKYVMFVTNGVLADTLLMYRCYVVWGRNKRVIFVPFMHLIATGVCGYLFEGAAADLFRHSWIYLAMTFSLNVILTILTAGRIWYLRRKTQSVMGEGLLQRYSATLAILVESGVLYSTYMVLDLAFQNHPTASTILDAGLIQIVGIMPTLIIVQVGLGRAIHDLENGSIDPLDRIEANKISGMASSRSFIGSDGNRSIHDARSFRDAIRSHRSLSDTTVNNDSTNRRGSIRSRGGDRPFGYYDYPNASVSKRTLYDMGSDNYTMPMLRPSPPSLPASPVYPLKSEGGGGGRVVGDWKLYYPQVLDIQPSRNSEDASTHYSPV